MRSKTGAYNGYYNGSMVYSYDKSTGYSYRKMTFKGPSGAKMPTETFICAAHALDQSDRVYMRLNTCDKCTYTPLTNKDLDGNPYYNCDELDPQGEFGINKNFYITNQVFQNNVLTLFETELNSYTILNYSVKTFNKAPDYFAKCLTKSCDIEMDFVFSIDTSGSMSGNRITAARSMIKTIVDQFGMESSNGTIAAAIIKWTDRASLIHSSISEIHNIGLITNYNKFKNDLNNNNNIFASGCTCLSCGYKALFEVSYINYVYEFNRFTTSESYTRFKMAGKVGILLTDGVPTHYGYTEFVVKEDVYTGYNWNGWRTQNTYYCYEADVTDNINEIKNNAQTFYGGSGLLRNGNNNYNFYHFFTIIVIGAYEASGATTRGYFETIGLRADSLTPSFSVVYSITDLSDSNVMSRFYDGLKSDICSSFSGDADKCTDLSKPCCKGQDNCAFNDYDLCKYEEPYVDPAGNCIYLNKHTSKCRNIVCDPVTGNTEDKGPKYPSEQGAKMKPCFNYTCDDINGWYPISSTPINCGNLLNNKDTCKIYTCDTTKEISWNEWPQYENHPEKYSSSNTCIFTDVCKIKNCEEYHTVPGVNSAEECRSPNKWEELEKKCYKLVPVNGLEKDCFKYSCSVVNGESIVTHVSVDCGNKCKHCEYNNSTLKNECVHYDACKNDYNAHPLGCWSKSTCVEALNNGKGECVESVNLCDKVTDFCTLGLCNRNASTGYTSGECYTQAVECTLPSHLSLGGCYDISCINEKGGCMIIIDFSKLNECGDCGEYSTCDESALVVTAAIGAGVVAAIVVVAVIALSVGLIASKKMYDMISGANEARMDTAQENQLYKSADNGGSNPLFD